MTAQDKTTLKGYFINGVVAREENFADLIDSLQAICLSQNAITNYTFDGTEESGGGYLVNTSGGNITINLDADLFSTGWDVSICKGTDNTNTVTIDAQAGNNINGSQTFVLDNYTEVVTLLKDGANAWKIKSRYNNPGASDNNKLYFGAGKDMFIQYDGTNGQINLSGVNPSDLVLTTGAGKTLKFSNTYTTDIDFPIIIRTTGANIPTLATLQGNITAPQWQVNDYSVLEGQELVHSWKEGSDLLFHIHLITNGSDIDNRYVAFEVEYCFANPNGVLSAGATLSSGDLLIPAGTTTKTHIPFSIGTLSLPTSHITCHIWTRLKRVASSGTAPTSNPWVTMLQAHIENDTMGSRTTWTK